MPHAPSSAGERCRKIDNQMAASVTGGASGLGQASARALADAGLKVAIFDLNENSGKEVAKSIGGVFCKTDVLDEESVLQSLKKAREAHGQERVLVHCAAAGSPPTKTVYQDRKTAEYKRQSTERFAFATEGILVASHPPGINRSARHGVAGASR